MNQGLQTVVFFFLDGKMGLVAECFPLLKLLKWKKRVCKTQSTKGDTEETKLRFAHQRCAYFVSPKV